MCDEIKDNTVEFIIRGSFNGKQYAASVSNNILENGKFNSEQVFQNACWMGLLILVTIEKNFPEILGTPASNLKDFEIPRLFKCKNSPLYEKDKVDNANS